MYQAVYHNRELIAKNGTEPVSDDMCLVSFFNSRDKNREKVKIVDVSIVTLKMSHSRDHEKFSIFSVAYQRKNVSVLVELFLVSYKIAF